MPSITETLMSHAPFDDVDQSTVDKFAEAAMPKNFAKGDVIVVEHAINDSIFFILEGTVRGSAAWSNHDEPIELTDGAYFGLNAFVDDDDDDSLSSLSAIAASNVKLLVWKASTWRDICDADVATGYRVALFVARSLNRRLTKWLTSELDSVSWGIE